jgi:uncharacterized membrane protein YraQ (UPF0718 family)
MDLKMTIFVNTATGVVIEAWALLVKMAPYLLFGFLFAGLLHIFLSPEKIARHLGRGNFSSVFKAALFGVPLPLCSCGVIPAALSLRREGASIGAVLAFLISTPTTGIDSIFATLALMGGLFTVYRIAASFAIGLLAGILANILIKEARTVPQAKDAKECCHHGTPYKSGLKEKVVDAFRYAFVELFDDVAKWLALGVLIGGAISFFLPEGFFAGLIRSNWLAYIVMFLIGTPMYVCATGSIPIAASLMMKGLSPGAALVFLISGPATNTVTITVMMKELGRKAVIIYLGSIFAGSVALAFMLDRIWVTAAASDVRHHAIAHGAMLLVWLGSASALLLSVLIVHSLFRTSQKRVGML